MKFQPEYKDNKHITEISSLSIFDSGKQLASAAINDVNIYLWNITEKTCNGSIKMETTYFYLLGNKLKSPIFSVVLSDGWPVLNE